VPLAEFSDRFPHAVRGLLRARQRQRLAHAYLFAGDSPEILEQFATAWLQVCACQTPTDSGDACDACTACRQVADGCYPGLVCVRPVSRSRMIVLAQIRPAPHDKQTALSQRLYPPDQSLIYRLNLSISPGTMRLALVQDADRMTPESENSFLKTLEEPLPRTVIVLTSTQPKLLLPTIRSRCQIVTLLCNRRTYDFPVECGLFPLLGRLRPGTGASVALDVSGRIRELFAQLRARAEERIGGLDDDRWNVVAAGNAELKKHLEEERKTRLEAEYVRLRTVLLDAVETWFQQLSALVAGIPVTELPHPEIIENAGVTADELTAIPWDQVEKCCRLVAELLRDLRSNVHEGLALQAFCLSVCEKAL